MKETIFPTVARGNSFLHANVAAGIEDSSVSATTCRPDSDLLPRPIRRISRSLMRLIIIAPMRFRAGEATHERSIKQRSPKQKLHHRSIAPGDAGDPLAHSDFPVDDPVFRAFSLQDSTHSRDFPGRRPDVHPRASSSRSPRHRHVGPTLLRAHGWVRVTKGVSGQTDRSIARSLAKVLGAKRRLGE